MDPGTSDNLGLVWIAETSAGQWAVVADRLHKYTTIQGLVDEINAINSYWGADKFQYIIKDWAGGSGQVFASELPGYNLPIVKPHGRPQHWKSVEAGIKLVRNSLYTGELQISRDCAATRQDLNLYVCDASGNPDKKAHDPHTLDALRYAWIRIYAYER